MATTTISERLHMELKVEMHTKPGFGLLEERRGFSNDFVSRLDFLRHIVAAEIFSVYIMHVLGASLLSTTIVV